MSGNEILGAIAHLPDDAQVTISVRKADLARALEEHGGGPETLSTAQAAKHLGWTSRNWRDWADQGKIAGAWRDDVGRWRLPRRSCEEHVARLRNRSVPREERSVRREPWSTKRRRAQATGAPTA